jgi:fructose-bisphosphate aldolase class II
MKDIRYYLKKAQAEYFAIGQFNFSDFTQLKAIVAKSSEMKSPVILGTSEGESKFFGLEEAVALRNVLRNKFKLPIFLNLDHGHSFEYLKQAIDAGYDMVHFDGSKLPLEENIKITKEVVKYAKWKNVTVEGEVGRIGTDSSKLYDNKFEIEEENLTKPEEVFKFLNETKVNLLAVSIGNFHGIEISGICPNLRLDRLVKIQESIGQAQGRTKNVFLVLHGGSGTPEDDMKEAIKMGIVKININTELRLSFSGNLRRALNDNPEEIVPYKFLLDAKNSMERLVELKIKIFGSEGKA